MSDDGWSDNIGCSIMVVAICIFLGFAVHSCSSMYKTDAEANNKCSCEGCEHEDE